MLKEGGRNVAGEEKLKHLQSGDEVTYASDGWESTGVIEGFATYTDGRIVVALQRGRVLLSDITSRRRRVIGAAVDEVLFT